MNFRDPFERNGGGLGKWPTLKGVSRPKQQGPEPATAPEDAPTPEMIQANTPRPDASEERPKARLSDSAWVESDTLFHQEAEVSVKLSLPEGKEHITRVQVELFARTADGTESIAKSEGHAQPDGTAVVTLPIYKPKNHDGGPVDYFFRVMHTLADMLTGENTLRTVSEKALKSADHILIPGTVFGKDSSFIPPHGIQALKRVGQKFQEWEKRHPQKSQIAVFGHADPDEKDAKALSERRAQSAYAFITEDAATWERLYGIEKWGLEALQALLKDLNHYHSVADGKGGAKTQAAFRALQKEAGLPETGTEDSATRKALFSAYMHGKRDVKIEASRFCKVAGNPWMGCAAHNQVKESPEPAPENRRVAFVLITPSKSFPVHFPCRDGSEAACLAQCKRKGLRSTPGIRCAFYDELVREAQQSGQESETRPQPESSNPSESFDVDKAIEYLQNHLFPKSEGMCANHVRLAILAGGIKIYPNPVPAKDYGPYLAKYGFTEISKENYAPAKGDISVIQPYTGGKPYGHITMFSGEIWLSDFAQRDMWSGPKYREQMPPYQLFRWVKK